MTTTRFVSFVSAAACVLFASGCKSTEGVVDPYVAIAGYYTLLTANGQLPLRYFHTDPRDRKRRYGRSCSGTLSLTTTGTFQEILQYHVTPPPPDLPYDAPLATADRDIPARWVQHHLHLHSVQRGAVLMGRNRRKRKRDLHRSRLRRIAGGLTAVYSR